MSLAQTTATALAGQEIRANAICPGLTLSGMTAPIFMSVSSLDDSTDLRRGKTGETDGRVPKVGRLTALQRHGISEEIASAAIFLASDMSSFVNGQALAVDGGLSSSHPYVAGARW